MGEREITGHVTGGLQGVLIGQQRPRERWRRGGGHPEEISHWASAGSPPSQGLRSFTHRTGHETTAGGGVQIVVGAAGSAATSLSAPRSVPSSSRQAGAAAHPARRIPRETLVLWCPCPRLPPSTGTDEHTRQPRFSKGRQTARQASHLGYLLLQRGIRLPFLLFFLSHSVSARRTNGPAPARSTPGVVVSLPCPRGSSPQSRPPRL